MKTMYQDPRLHKPLTHQQRRRLIESPLPTTRVIGGKSHGGYTIFKSSALMNPSVADVYPNTTLWEE